MWKDKKERLKCRVLIKNKEEGGLKVPSFKFIVDSVKLKCFLQIFDSDSEQVWALLARQYFKTNNLDLSAAIKCPELSTCTKNLTFPSFYTKTFQLWDELIETEPCRKELFIWYNPGIKINNTSIFWKRFFDIGILYICDLFEPDGSTIAFEQWLHKGLTHRDLLNWAGLVSCLKQTSIFLQNNLNTRTIESGLRFNNQECLISEGKISQKIVYNGILELRNIDVHVPRIERYSENSGDVNWSLIFSRVYKVCLEVKLIEFQYCFLHDILINNFWLNTWKLREDWLCTFCNEEIEDLGHLFWECHFTQLFWEDF